MDASCLVSSEHPVAHTEKRAFRYSKLRYLVIHLLMFDPQQLPHWGTLLHQLKPTRYCWQPMIPTPKFERPLLLLSHGSNKQDASEGPC